MKKLCGLNKKIDCHGNFPWAITTPFHSNHLRQKGYQSWKFLEDRWRTFWNNWPRANSTNRKQFWQLGSSKVIKMVPFDGSETASKATIIMLSSCRLEDTTWRIKRCGSVNKKSFAMATSVQESKKLTSCRTAKVHHRHHLYSYIKTYT